MFGTGFFCGWPKYMSLCLSPKAKASWELRKATKKSPWHNNHLPYIVKERTYLLGSTPCVRVGHGASIFFPDGVRLEPLIFGQTWRHSVPSCIKYESLINIVCLLWGSGLFFLHNWRNELLWRPFYANRSWSLNCFFRSYSSGVPNCQKLT